MWKSIIKSKVKKGVSILTTAMILGSLTPSLKVFAEDTPKVIAGYSETKPDVPKEIERNGVKYKLKGEPQQKPERKLEPPIIKYKRQDVNTDYFLKAIPDGNGNYRISEGTASNMWDPTVVNGRQVGYNVLPYKPGHERWSLYADKVDHNKGKGKVDLGQDFLGKDLTTKWKGTELKYTAPTKFDADLKLKVSKEQYKKIFGLSDLPKSIEDKVFQGKDYVELKGELDYRAEDSEGNKNIGINYKQFHDYTVGDEQLYERGKTYPESYLNQYLFTINGEKYVKSGSYGDEEFNYYVEPITVPGGWFYEYEAEGLPDDPDPKPPSPKPSSGDCGRIVYNPDKTEWTNRGKISNGVGDYTIDIKATKPEIILQGVTRSHDICEKCGKNSCHTYVCNRTSDTFDVTYDLDRIESRGATNDTVKGGSGTIHIRQEGGGQEVRSIGKWKSPSYTVYYSGEVLDSTTMPDPPCEPQGHAGKYDIDWTDPVIKVEQKAPSKWRNDPYYQPIDVTITDNLSGFDSAKSYIQITDISHYKHNYKINLNEASLEDVNHWDLADGIYKIDIVVWDRAGNHSEYHDEWFKVDGIPPDITISDQGYHRHIDSLTFDTTVSDNIEELEELTVSGWGTYGSEKAKVANQTKVVRPITYPHIQHEDTNYTFYYKVEDLATNQTTKKFVTSVVREYWKWAHTTYGKNFDTEVPVKILSSKDTKSLEGFTKSKTIDFDTWKGMPVEVWYKFKDHYNVNFIRVIHYDNPNLPIITGNGEKLYPDGKGSFKDAPPLSNEIGLEVGTDEYVESFGKATDPMPIKVVDNGDGTMTNYYVNGDIRRIDKSSGNVIATKDKTKYGVIIPDSINRGKDKIVYHTTTRYRIEVIFGSTENTLRIYDRNNNLVEQSKIKRANA